jgi:hypothetical protein
MAVMGKVEKDRKGRRKRGRERGGARERTGLVSDATVNAVRNSDSSLLHVSYTGE